MLAICIFHPFHSGYRLTGSLANIEDPDEMPHDAAFHRVLHCLFKKGTATLMISKFYQKELYEPCISIQVSSKSVKNGQVMGI